MSLEFLDIQATIVCRFTLKGVRDMLIIMYRKSNKRSNIDRLGALFMAAESKKIVPNKTKNLFVRCKGNILLLHLKNLCP